MDCTFQKINTTVLKGTRKSSMPSKNLKEIDFEINHEEKKKGPSRNCQLPNVTGKDQDSVTKSFDGYDYDIDFEEFMKSNINFARKEESIVNNQFINFKASSEGQEIFSKNKNAVYENTNNAQKNKSNRNRRSNSKFENENCTNNYKEQINNHINEDTEVIEIKSKKKINSPTVYEFLNKVDSDKNYSENFTQENTPDSKNASICIIKNYSLFEKYRKSNVIDSACIVLLDLVSSKSLNEEFPLKENKLKTKDNLDLRSKQTKKESISQVRYSELISFNSKSEFANAFSKGAYSIQTLTRIMKRFFKYTKYSEEILIYALGLISRLMLKNLNLLTKYNLTRIWVLSLLVASKNLIDNVYPASFYAKIFGLEVKELFTLEYSYLVLIEFECYLCSINYEKSREKLVEILKTTSKR